MTTPVIYSSQYIIKRALQNACVLGRGEEPDSEYYADGITRLTTMINTWQTQGLKLWLQYNQPIIPVIGQAAYTLMPGGTVNMTKPIRVLDSCYYADSAANNRPLLLISQDDYNRLSTQTALGAVSSLFVKKNLTNLTVYMWPTPDAGAATGTVYVLIEQQITTPVALTDQVAFPPEWGLALEWGLADQKSVGQPVAIQQRCAAEATKYRTMLEDWDVEDASTSFAPDPRMYYTGFGMSR